MNTVRIKVIFAIIVIFSVSVAAKSGVKEQPSLKNALKHKFLMGVALNANQISGMDAKSLPVILQHFNSIVAENCMKSEVVQPNEGQFDFEKADQFVKFGEQHHMVIIGHTLIWHSQAPKWFFVDGKGLAVTKEVLIDRMKTHIFTVVKRYKGKVKGWDVVNEAFNDDGSYRESPFYKIIGKDYIKYAFQFAHEADPKAELYYNDYSMAKEGRRNSVVRMVKELQSEGIKVSAIGMQGHLTMDFPAVEDFEKSIIAFAATGAKVMITEMDITIIPFPSTKVSADVALRYKYDAKMNPYPNGLPDSVATTLHDRYASFFRLFLKHADKISRVTVWGLTDSDSWRNDWPIAGRTDYPLLFDRNYQPKPIVNTIIKMAKEKSN